MDGVPVTEVCSRHGITPGQFYKWQQQLFENGTLALTSYKGKDRPEKTERDLKHRISYLERKLKQREEVVAELMSDHIT